MLLALSFGNHLRDGAGPDSNGRTRGPRADWGPRDALVQGPRGSPAVLSRSHGIFVAFRPHGRTPPQPRFAARQRPRAAGDRRAFICPPDSPRRPTGGEDGAGHSEWRLRRRLWGPACPGRAPSLDPGDAEGLRNRAKREVAKASQPWTLERPSLSCERSLVGRFNPNGSSSFLTVRRALGCTWKLAPSISPHAQAPDDSQGRHRASWETTRPCPAGSSDALQDAWHRFLLGPK